jgi:hypothetical protein
MQTFFFLIAAPQIDESAQFWESATAVSATFPVLFDCCFWIQPLTHVAND